MANFPDSISTFKIQRPVTRRSVLASVGAIAAASLVTTTPAVATVNPIDGIQKIVRDLERLGCYVLLVPFKDEHRVFVGNSKGIGCISNAMWKRIRACDYDMFADFLRATGRVQRG